MNQPTNQNAHDPAHPAQELIGYTENGPGFRYFPGLSKRELIAAMAMQGILSTSDERTYPSEGGDAKWGSVEKWRAFIDEEDAKYAIRKTDALLAELEKAQ